jgi:hypothetical protein
MRLMVTSAVPDRPIGSEILRVGNAASGIAHDPGAMAWPSVNDINQNVIAHAFGLR